MATVETIKEVFYGCVLESTQYPAWPPIYPYYHTHAWRASLHRKGLPIQEYFPLKIYHDATKRETISEEGLRCFRMLCLAHDSLVVVAGRESR